MIQMWGSGLSPRPADQYDHTFLSLLLAMSSLFYTDPPCLATLDQWLDFKSISRHAGIAIEDGPHGWQVISHQAIPRGSVCQ